MVADLLPNRVGEFRIPCGKIATAPVAIGDPDDGELLRVLDREGAQTHCIEKLKDGRVRAYSQRQRGDGDCGEAHIESEGPRGVTNVLPQAVHSHPLSNPFYLDDTTPAWVRCSVRYWAE